MEKTINLASRPGMKRVPIVCVVGLLLLMATGCGGAAQEYDAVVTGTVTIDGELAKSGTVTFQPVKKGVPAIGRIYPDGSYSLRTGQGNLRESDGGTVMPGEYLVTVSITAPPATGSVIAEGGPPIPGPSLVASKYAQMETTDLRFTVKSGNQVIVLNLERAEPTPPAEEAPPAATGKSDSELEAAPEGAATPESTAEKPAETSAQ